MIAPYGGFSPLNSKYGCFLPVFILIHLVDILDGIILFEFKFKFLRGEISSKIHMLFPWVPATKSPSLG